MKRMTIVGTAMVSVLITGHVESTDVPVPERLSKKESFRESMGELGTIDIMFALQPLKRATENIDTSEQEYQNKKQAVKQFIESLENAPIAYTIRTQKYMESVGRGWGAHTKETDEYIVTLPNEIQERLSVLDKQTLHDTFYDYYNDKKHSFTVAVLMMAEASPFRPAPVPFIMPPHALLKKDKTSWNKNKDERKIFLQSYFYSLQRAKERVVNEN